VGLSESADSLVGVDFFVGDSVQGVHLGFELVEVVEDFPGLGFAIIGRVVILNPVL